ncbi:MAG: O-antigen ligase family protein [Bacillota bacterium]|nr:O-antigen ligase family protein [Bacillota bacterium]
MKTILENSMLTRFPSAMSRGYRHSGTRRLWTAFCETKDPAETSGYQRFLRKVQNMLRTFARWGENGASHGVASAAGRLSTGTVRRSLILSKMRRIPLHRWFLVLFALYLPVEYALRDVLRLTRIASIWEELLIAAGALLVLWRGMRNGNDSFARGNLLEAAILLYMGVGLLLMVLNRPFPAVALAGYRAQVQYMVWFFLILRLLEDRKDAATLYGVFAAVVFFLSLHGIYQYAVGVEIPASWVSQTEAGVRTRVFSITGSPNIFGSLIVMAAPMLAALMYYCKTAKWKIASLLAVGAACLCILFTFSRGAWVGLIVAVVLFALYVDKRLLLLMTGAMAGILAAVPSITARLTYLFTTDYAEASAIGGRALRWQVGHDLLMENSPWLGFGLGRFGGAVAMNNQLLDETETFRYFYMDNYYLKTLVEMGYLGLIFFLLVLAVFAVSGFRAVHRSGAEYETAESKDALCRNIGNPKLLTAGIFSGLSGVLVHCYFENIFEEPYMMSYFWGLAALMIYLGLFAKKSGKTISDDRRASQ